MNQLNETDAEKILSAVRIGLWRVEFEEGKPTRFYADAVMDELLGVTGDVTPEERFRFHIAHVHPADMSMFQEYADKLTKVRTEIVYRYLHPLKGEMIVRCSGVRDMSEKGFIYTMGTHQDISETVRLERKREMERRLTEMNKSLQRDRERREDYYRELLDIQSCGILAYTIPDHRVVHMNAQALRMYGIKNIGDAQGKIGNALRSVYYPKPGTVERLRKLQKEDDSVDYECIIGKGSSNESHIVAKTKIVQIPTGERAALTTFVDISEMMVLKNALRQAEEGSRAKSAFLFAMSHDLRTPMNAIIGYANLMETHWGEQELTAGYLKKLKEASQFLLGLIGNVLELARIESGKESLSEEVWDMRKLEDTIEVLLNDEIARKHLKLEKHMRVTHPYIYCDAMKLREILMNLMSNAVKYTPAGGKICLTMEELPSEKAGYAQFRGIVEDSGIGISAEYLPHIFEEFTRERNSSESGIQGTGLGLRIVKSFVDMMDGSIQVESEQGKGTRFTVLLSCRIAEKNDLEQKEASADRLVLSGKRILLAEDNVLNAEIAMTLLADAQAEVDLAEDGVCAIQRLREVPEGYYDLILTDIQMPRMNGYEMAKAIRALPDAKSTIPIIAMTANAFDEDRRAALAAGMDGYVVKPVETAALGKAIAELKI